MQNFLILTTEINVRSGPTVIGNETADPEMMKSLGGVLKSSTSTLGSKIYEAPHDIAVVMEKAKIAGYTVISTTGLGQTFIVTLERK